jgi:hypothetical protein
MDCNFQLAHKKVSSEEADPGLCQGTTYFVEQSKYKQHLEKNNDLPQEVSIFYYQLLSTDILILSSEL